MPETQQTRWSVHFCQHCVGVTSLVKTFVGNPGRALCPNCLNGMGDPFEVVVAVGARSSDPDTSKLAALQNEPRRGSQRAKILLAVRASGPTGLTAREAADNTGIEGAWKRVSELKQGGHITTTGATRRDRKTGAESDVYVAAGLAASPAAVLRNPSHVVLD